MKRAYLNLRGNVPERVAAFRAGLKRVDYEVLDHSGACELFVTWNRIGWADSIAREREAHGIPVLVAENAAWGNGFQGGRWLSLARGMHNTAGRSPYGGGSRWDALGVELADYRPEGGEMVILPSRGIGPAGVAMPRGWAEAAARRFGARIRPHPGRAAPRVSLRDDLAHASWVDTWGSGAAVLAAMWGIVVRSDMPGWIGEHWPEPFDRLRMLRELAWHQWRLEEIESGEAFAYLLGGIA